MMLPLDMLLVESNPDDAGLIRQALAAGGHSSTLSVLTDSQAVLEHLRMPRPNHARQYPDIILLDISMPGRDGYDTLKQLKADPVLRSIPVIVLHPSSDPCDIRYAYENHANCYVTKPVDRDEIQAVGLSIQHFWSSVAHRS